MNRKDDKRISTLSQEKPAKAVLKMSVSLVLLFGFIKKMDHIKI